MTRTEAVDRFVGGLAMKGDALMVCGDHGGLLERAADGATAAGYRVVRVVGARFETDMPYAALNQLLVPLVDDVDVVSGSLAAALGFGAGAVDPADVAEEALALLAWVTRDRPVLLVLADLHRADRESVGVLELLAPRLSATTRAGLLATGDVPAPGFRTLVMPAPANPDLGEITFGSRRALLDLALSRSRLGTPANLYRARAAGLITVDARSGTVAFTDPATATALLRSSTGEERRQAHGRLAALPHDDPAVRTRHLAQATVGCDEEIAAMLEDAGRRALAAGDPVSAAEALERAAYVSPAAADRGRRLAEAARVKARMPGAGAEVSGLLAEARLSYPETAESLAAVLARASVLISTNGDVRGAYRLLASGIAKSGERGPALAEAVQTLLIVCVVGHDLQLWAEFDEILARHAAHLPSALVAAAEHLSRPGASTPAMLERLDRSISALDENSSATTVFRVSVAAYGVDRVAGCCDALRRIVAATEPDQVGAEELSGLMILAFEDMRAGRWELALREAGNGLRLSRRNRLPLQVPPGRYVQAYVHAARGEYGELHRLDVAAYQWAVPRGVNSVRAHLGHANGLAALSRGDFEEAYAILKPVAAPFDPHDRYAPWMLLDFVEACLLTLRNDEARAHLAAADAAGVPRLSRRSAFLSAGAAAMAAPSDQAEALYAAVLADPEAEAGTFHRARVELAYGRLLRRRRRAREARRVLLAARTTFEQLGARPWAERAAAESDATAGTRKRESLDLTPQERAVAELAAAGLTNRQIGERLQVSHRTVGTHLSHVFRKLEVPSRAALRSALFRVTRGCDRPMSL